MTISKKTSRSNAAPLAANIPLPQCVGRPGSDKRQIAAQVIAAPELLPQLVAGLESEQAAIKYGCEKVLMLLSEQAPALLYPRMDYFVTLLDSQNNFLKWGAIHIIAHLSTVDTENRFDAIIDRYFAPLAGPVMITAGNLAKAVPVIAAAKPHLTARLVRELLKVEHAQSQTDECRHVALGHVILAFDHVFGPLPVPAAVIALVKRQLASPRPATRRKAEKFVRKHRLL